MPSVVPFSRPRVPTSTDTMLTPADLTPRRVVPLEMGCHLDVFTDETKPSLFARLIRWVLR